MLVEPRGKRWLYRGQSKRYNCLVPTIDHKLPGSLSRLEKLKRERQSIDLFRATARFFSHPGEEGALTDDIIALMVLRHYGVPTRLLDWSWSPLVAAYFAVCDNDTECGEIWSFDEPLYEQKGKQQWENCPETTTDGSGKADKFDAKLTAFLPQTRCDWFICGFYETGFHRQNIQNGAYTLTAQFDRDHAVKIAELLGNRSKHCLHVISATLKPKLRSLLLERYGIWRGSLFPDSAGAAENAKIAFAEKTHATRAKSR